MKPCIQCERHILPADVECPFCGTAQSCAPPSVAGQTWGARAWLLAGALGAVACGSAVDDGGLGESSSGGAPSTSNADTSAGTTVGTTVGTSVGTSVGTTEATDSTSTTSTDDDQGDFEGAFYALPPDGGVSPLECDVWAQDCPKGEKCSPVALGGASAYDGTHCTPLDPRPAAVGDECTVTGGPFSGVDNCGLGVLCWNVDAETGTGVCVELCQGAANAPLCNDPANACAVFDPAIVAVCLPTCDIVDDMCPDGEVCMTVVDVDVCVPG